MIHINLLPEELRRKEPPKLHLPEIPIKKTLIGIGLALVALQVALSLLALFFGLRAVSVQREIDRLKIETKSTQDLKAKTSDAEGKIQKIRQMTEKKFYWTSLLNAISESMTKGVWLRSLSLEDVTADPKKSSKKASAKKNPAKKATGEVVRALKIEGSVMAPGQETAFIGRYVKALKEHPYFAELFMDAQLAGINQRKIKDFDVYDFTLLCKFRKGKI